MQEAAKKYIILQNKELEMRHFFSQKKSTEKICSECINFLKGVYRPIDAKLKEKIACIKNVLKNKFCTRLREIKWQ